MKKMTAVLFILMCSTVLVWAQDNAASVPGNIIGGTVEEINGEAANGQISIKTFPGEIVKIATNSATTFWDADSKFTTLDKILVGNIVFVEYGSSKQEAKVVKIVRALPLVPKPPEK